MKRKYGRYILLAIAILIYGTVCSLDRPEDRSFELTDKQRAEVIGRQKEPIHSIEYAAAIKNQGGRW